METQTLVVGIVPRGQLIDTRMRERVILEKSLLVEHYGYEQIVETSTPSDVDFSAENPAYRFVAAVTAGGNE